MIMRELSLQEALDASVKSLAVERQLAQELARVRQVEQSLMQAMMACKEARLALEVTD